ncbi:MAG: zinc ribbon domain-containing protein [Thermodesulfobacteriota bacterium]|nr:zinc ribbon domain-containing protein [Thermodesulfobacteriota bacterium]
MPIYEYECKKCGHNFEVFHEIDKCDADLQCPECHTENPKRLLSFFCSGHKDSVGRSCNTAKTT